MLTEKQKNDILIYVLLDAKENIKTDLKLMLEDLNINMNDIDAFLDNEKVA